MGFLSVPNLIPWLNIQSLNRIVTDLLDQIPLQLDREGIKDREDDESFFLGGGGRLFEGDDYFKYFYQREVIIRGRQLIEGRLLFEEIRYL